MLTLEQLMSHHPEYKRVAEQSNYYLQSYLGGYVYRAGGHLTPYLNESTAPGDQYNRRLNSTPLDNHVATTIDIYRSFLFRTLPKRELGSLINNPLVFDWVNDTDQEGQSMDSFLKTANDLAMVCGSIWMLVDKPNYKVETQAQEIALGLRAYACAYTPENVLDFRYVRNEFGKVNLEYVKVRENENPETTTITCWYADSSHRYVIAKDPATGEYSHIAEYTEYVNPLGYVPFVQHIPLRSTTRGVGQSLVADIADSQRFLYNLYSELEQTIRISSHPTLVKTPATTANAGAGAIITMQEDMDPGLKPFLLQPTSAGIDGIINTINSVVEGIKRMAHTDSIQAANTSGRSGVSIQVERQLLQAKLADISDTLRETELRMWGIWCDWQNLELPDEFDVIYSDSYDVRDRTGELDFLLKAKAAGITDPAYVAVINRQIMELTVEDSEEYDNLLKMKVSVTNSTDQTDIAL